MHELKKGILISFEGIDGSGKTTLITKVFQALKQLEFPVLLTKEPGATALGANLRSLVHDRPFLINAKAEYLLFAADRAQHFEEIIIPALQTNTLILSDRLADSSLVYQGYGRGLDLSMIQTINNWAMDGITPDLTVYIKLPLAVALERLRVRKQTLTYFEKEKKDFTEKLIEGFNTIFAKHPNVVYLDGQESPEILE